MELVCRGCGAPLPARQGRGRPRVWCSSRCKSVARHRVLRSDPDAWAAELQSVRVRRVLVVHRVRCAVCGTEFDHPGGGAPASRCRAHRAFKSWVECPCGTALWKRNPDAHCSRACYRSFHPPAAPDERTRKGRRRTWESGAPGLNQHQRRRLLLHWQRRGRTCWTCPEFPDTVDHVIPVSRGGTNHEGNLVPACKRHNSSRRALLITEWRFRNGRSRPAAERDTEPEPSAT
ncbi:HNH endonuclease [Pseudonocardia parietis]